jgi:hypothetical protein
MAKKKTPPWNGLSLYTEQSVSGPDLRAYIGVELTGPMIVACQWNCT